MNGLIGQTSKVKLYNPEADAKSDILEAVAKAKQEGKHVLLQIGGNWCGWCISFDKTVKSDASLKRTLDASYVTYHLNYSKGALNEGILASLGYPQRFGFPVFVVLDGDGKRLHTQSSAYLEEGKGHSVKKVMTFFNSWTPAAINPKNYPFKG